MSTPTTSKRNTNNNNTPNEADIIFNRANVALARSQRLVASWLPATEKQKKDGTDEADQAELQRLEDEMFTPVPERLGLGAPIPKQQTAADKLWTKTELSADDKLRQTLLGRNWKKFQEQKQAAVAAAAAAAAKNRASGSGTSSNPDKHSRTNNNDNEGEDDDDEEEGRSALGKSKKIKAKSSSSLANEKNEEDGDTSMEKTAPKKSKTTAVSKRKGAGSFLDDLLSDRKKKRKK